MMRKNISAEEWALARIKLELGNRHILVLLHGLLLFEIGLIMMLTGAPDFFSEWFGVHARIWMGLGATVPGAALIVGAWLGDDRRPGYWVQLFSLAGVVAWHAVMSFLYGMYVFRSGVVLLGLNELAPAGSARLYVPLVYTNILFLALVHLVTLLRLGRPPR